MKATGIRAQGSGLPGSRRPPLVAPTQQGGSPAFKVKCIGFSVQDLGL